MTTVAKKFNFPVDMRLNKVCSEVVGKVHVGLEVEIENLLPSHMRGELTYWQIGEDGSLRPQGRSAELRFLMPLFGQDIVLALEEFDNWFWKDKYKPDCSSRCSLHCHVDVRDLEISELCSFWAASLIAEGMLFGVSSPERYNSAFCMPHAQRANANFKQQKENYILDYLIDMEKYTSINSRNLPRLGTIEFRMHGPCVDTKKMLQWVNILISLRENSKKYKPTDFIGMSPKEFCNTVFGDFAKYVLPYVDFKWEESYNTGLVFIKQEVLNKHAGSEVALRKTNQED